MKEKETLFEAYKAKFNFGDTLVLKPLNVAEAIHNEWTDLINNVGIPVDWCPLKEDLEKYSKVEFNVIDKMFFHGGVPLYVLSFEYENKPDSIRICESFLTLK